LVAGTQPLSLEGLATSLGLHQDDFRRVAETVHLSRAAPVARSKSQAQGPAVKRSIEQRLPEGLAIVAAVMTVVAVLAVDPMTATLTWAMSRVLLNA